MMFILYVLLSSAGIILFKLGSSQLSFEITKETIGLNLSFLSITGLICYIISFLLWMAIISKNDVSYIVPIGLAATNIAILIASALILGESISIIQTIGVGVIILGVFLLNV
ncbi:MULTISPECIES: EamA family transporter [Enterococcus]|uniref:EamA family transporter n=1 Tax=Enterococcus TaxID=1350 RepID=UPI0024904F52|nr:EamA family transporter [Enterococcus dispar]